MLLQRAGTGTIPPSGFTPPPWSSLQGTWESSPRPSTPTVTLGPDTLVLGHDDNEMEDEEPGKDIDVKDHEFGWDNENPKRTVDVGEFKIEWRPVTNGDFYEFWKSCGRDKVQLPKSWVEEDGEIMVGPLSSQIQSLVKFKRHSCICFLGPYAVWPNSSEDREPVASAHFLQQSLDLRKCEGRPSSYRARASSFL